METLDAVAKTDQAAKAASEVARVIAAFHVGLLDQGASEETARQLTILYTRYVLKMKE